MKVIFLEQMKQAGYNYRRHENSMCETTNKNEMYWNEDLIAAETVYDSVMSNLFSLSLKVTEPEPEQTPTSVMLSLMYLEVLH